MGGPAGVLVFRILGNADDFIVAAVTRVHSEVLADRILVRKESARKRFVDDGYVWGARLIAFADDASSQQARANRLEVMRTNPIPGGRREAIVGYFSLNEDAFVRVATAQRAVPRQACAQDAGYSRHLLPKPLIERRKLLWRVTGQPRFDIHDQAAFRDKPEMLVFQIAQALRDQARSNQKHNRERNLCDNQRLLQNRRPIARGTAHSAQGFERIRLGRCPGG